MGRPVPALAQSGPPGPGQARSGQLGDGGNCLPRTDDPSRCGRQAVQILRTYPHRRRAFPFAPEGERSVARGITKALRRGRRLVYVEDQYLWSRQAVAAYCQALAAEPELLLVAVVSAYPDQDGRLSTAPNLIGRLDAMRALDAAGGQTGGSLRAGKHGRHPGLCARQAVHHR